jgi:hypothetical protein
MTRTKKRAKTVSNAAGIVEENLIWFGAHFFTCLSNPKGEEK